MKIAVCDDDKKDIARLKKYLADYDEIRHMGLSISEYESGKHLLKAVRNGKEADIIFLDINISSL